MPCDASSEALAEYQAILEEIQCIMQQNRSSSVIIGGDLNVDLHNKERKKRAFNILDSFMAENDLVCLSRTLGDSEAYTYQSDDGTKRSNIDTFLTHSKSAGDFSNLLIYNDEPLNLSDHSPIKVTWSPASSTVSEARTHHTVPSNPLRRPKVKWKELSKQMIKELYTEPLDVASEDILVSLADVMPDENLLDFVTARLQSALVQTSMNLPHTKGNGRGKGKTEWSPEVEECYQRHINMWKDWKRSGEDKNSPVGVLSADLKKAFRAKLRQARAACRNGLLSRIEEADEHNDRLFYTLVKEQGPGSDVHQLNLGGLTYSGPDIIQGWTRHFQDLATPSVSSPTQVLNPTHPENIDSLVIHHPQGLDHLFTSKELSQAISSLRPGKASGPDNISPEHLMYTGCTTRILILIMMNWMIHLKHIPLSLKDGLVIPLFKGGNKNPTDPGNYRGITLTPVLGKLLELLVKPKLSQHLQEHQIPDPLQFGFQRERSCTLTGKALDLVIEVYKSLNQPLYIAMLDAQKVFDTVWQDGLLSKIAVTRPPTVLLDTISEFYNSCSSKVFWKHEVGPSFPVLQGVRQGGVLSPMLYTLYINDLIKRLREYHLGCSVGNLYVGVIAFADDIALLSNEPMELQQMLNVTFHYTKEWKYKINPSKSAIIVLNQDLLNSDNSWQINGEPIAQVSSHKHLGIVRTDNLQYDYAADAITKGYRSFYALVGTSPLGARVVPHVAAKLWKTFCVPRMIFGCSSIPFSRAMLNRLDKAQIHLFKRILGLPTTSADEAVYLLTDVIQISLLVTKEKLLLLGQILCTDMDRIERRMLLHGFCANTKSIQEWRNALQQLSLPPLDELVRNPPNYHLWKRMVQSAVIQVSEARQHNALTKKTSLSLWTRTPKPKAKDLYPGHISNPSLRSAITIRAQISCQVYLTQVRLAKIGKAPDDCCRLCMSACEDVEHLVATCPALAPVRQDLIQRVKANPNTKQFGPCFESTPALF
ncbi:uncharacterized protein LOC135153482, partial [Lytechinus pictus]|uniref:uncharacterized protein LOC135153482 n=1 Tax=Lytechinus pictus TaxID=7653 RepID=UPI0030BA0FDA